MNALDELEEIKELVNNDKHFKYKNIVNFNCESIEKSLKALDLIVKKSVDVSLIKKYDFVEDYNSAVWIAGRPKLVKEEFNLLKEGLE